MGSTYKGYKDIPTHNFYEILENNDLNWFKKGYDGDVIELTHEEAEEFTKRFHQIYEDRIEYLGNVETEQYFQKLAEINSLETKIIRVTNTCKVIAKIPLSSAFFQRFVDDLKAEGFKFSKPIKTDEQALIYFKWLESRVKGERNKLKIKKIQYADILVQIIVVEFDSKIDDKVLNQLPGLISFKNVGINTWELTLESQANPKILIGEFAKEFRLKVLKLDTGRNKIDLVRDKIIVEEVLSHRGIDLRTAPLKEWDALCIRVKEKSKNKPRTRRG